MDEHNEIMTSFNSSANLTPKINLTDSREPKAIFSAVEMLLAQKNTDKDLHSYKTDEINVAKSNDGKTSKSAIRWPTKLEISFEQGLSPRSQKSGNNDYPRHKSQKFSRIVRKPLKTPKLSCDINFKVISRKLSVSRVNKTNKNINSSLVNEFDESNAYGNFVTPTQKSKDSSRIDIRLVCFR